MPFTSEKHEKIERVSSETWFLFASAATRVFRPAGRILQSGVTKRKNIKSFCHVIAVLLKKTTKVFDI